MEEPNKDLKNEEEETSTEDDHSEEKNPAESEEEEVSKEDDESSKDDKESDDEVTISKSELEQLRKDAKEKNNYRKAVIRLNRAKGQILPGLDPEPKKKNKVVDDDEDLDDDEKINTDDFVTKKELAARDEKQAINDACKDEEIALNWHDIVPFYQRPKDNTYETQSAAIASAIKLWKADKGAEETPEKEQKKEAKKVKKDLASDKGLGKGKEKKPTSEEKRSIIPKRSSMKDWY